MTKPKAKQGRPKQPAKPTKVRKRQVSATVSEGGGGEQGSGKHTVARTARAKPAPVRHKSDSPTPAANDPAPDVELDQPYGDPLHEPTGAPYSEADFLAVLRELAAGTPLRQVCRRSGYPSFQRVYQWKDEDEANARRFARACEEHEDALFDEILEIADDSSQDLKVVMTKSGPREVFDAEHVQRSKLRIYAREKWLAIRNQRKFGDKLEVQANHTFVRKVFRKGGGDGQA